MKRFWKRGNDLESRLERRRELARYEFVGKVAGEVRSSGRLRRRWAPARLALVSGLTLMLLVAVAAVGGVSAGAGVRDQLTGVVKSVTKKAKADQSKTRLAHDDDDDDDDSGDDQYKEERKQCRRAEAQRHSSAKAQIKRDYEACKRAEEQRHRTNMRNCGSGNSQAVRDCKKAEEARHKAAKKACHDEYERRRREEDQRHRDADRACKNIGRDSGGGGNDDDDD